MSGATALLKTEINELQDHLIRMRSVVATAARNAITALEDGDEEECLEILRSLIGKEESKATTATASDTSETERTFPCKFHEGAFLTVERVPAGCTFTLVTDQDDNPPAMTITPRDCKRVAGFFTESVINPANWYITVEGSDAQHLHVQRMRDDIFFVRLLSSNGAEAVVQIAGDDVDSLKLFLKRIGESEAE